MSKPTLVQKALNRPSQTYGNIDAHQTQRKEYYSTKQDMLRIAAAAASASASPGSSIDTRERNTTQMQPQTSATLARTLYYPSHRLHQYVRQGEDGDDYDDDGEAEGDSDLEVFFTPNTSPRTSMASSVATITFPGGATRKSSRRSLTNVTSAESHQPMLLPLPEQSASNAKTQVQTPTQSQTQMSGAVPSTRTPSTSSISRSSSTRSRHPALASSSSLSSTSLDGHSVFSSEGGESTPYQSDRDVDRSATSTPRAKDRNRERERSSKSGNGTATITTNAAATGTGSAAGTTYTTGRSQPRVQPSSSAKSPAGGNGSASGKGDPKPPTSAAASPSTVTPAGLSHGSATTTIVIGSSRDAKGKEREREREKEKERERKSAQSNSHSHSASATSASASTSTPNPSASASPSTSTPKPLTPTSTLNPSTKPNSASSGTGTISISSRTKYVHPGTSSTSSTSSGSGSSSTKTPHTFSAFAAIGSGSSSSPGPGSTATGTATSASTPAMSAGTSSATMITPPQSLSRKGHRQITSSSANGAATFSTTTPRTSSSSSSSSPSTSTSTKTSTPKISPPSKIPASPKIPTASKIPSQRPPENANAKSNGNGYGDPTQVGHSRDKSRSSPSTSSGMNNGNAKHISSFTPSPSSSSSSSASASPSPASSSSHNQNQNQNQNQNPKQQQQHNQQHRKPPPPVLAPLPIQIQKPGSGQSGLMTMFGMDALLEEEEEEEEGGIYGEEYEDEEEEEEDEENGRSTPRMYDRGQGRGYGSSSSSQSQLQSTRPSTQASGSTHSRRPPPKTLSAEVTSLQQTFTAPGERPSMGTQGYTSLVLPRAPDTQVNGHTRMQVKASKDASSGKVDLTKSGVAQTTMASVEVVRGLGERARGKGVLGLFRLGRMGRERRERERPRGPLPIHIPGGNGDVNGAATSGGETGTTSVTPTTVNPNANVTPLGFTAYRAPPGHVPSGSVLVQVWAVGVDGVDGRLVGVRFGYENTASYAEGGGGHEHDIEDDGERTGEETEGEETEMETETETEREEVPHTEDEDEEDEGNILSTQSTPARPIQAQASPGKKGGLAALGRSFSLRLKKGGGEVNGKPSVQRSASAGAGAGGVAKSKMKAAVDTNHTNSSDPPVHKRTLSFSLKRSNTAASRVTNGTAGSSSTQSKSTGEGKIQAKPMTKGKGRKKNKLPKQPQAPVGYIPGRSFVGRVLECGWEVRDEIVRKGEWVVGLLDVRKGGALAEFIVVDRHRVHRVPQPQGGTASHPLWAMSPTSPSQPASPSQRGGFNNANPQPPPTLTLEELALLPLCGLPAYRAVRTFMFAFSSNRDGSLSGASSVDRRGLDFVGGNYAHGHKQPAGNPNNPNAMMMADHTDQGHRRRALVLRGHDGVGAMAVQMLARRGWLVSVHVPCSALPYDASPDVVDHFMQVTEERARAWGADEIIHDDSPQGGVPALNAQGEVDGQGLGGDDGRGAAVRLMDMIREDGDVFDAVLDTVGGKEVREAGERLLRSMGAVGVTRNGVPVNRRRGMGQFTTVVGDVPERVVPTAGDNFRAGLRSLRLGGTANANNHGHDSHPADGDEGHSANEGKGSSSSGAGKVGYAWVSVAQDVDWEGDDVGETLGTVVRMALEGGVRPVVEDIELSAGAPVSRVVPFEQAPRVFVDNGPLRDGGTLVVKIAE